MTGYVSEYRDAFLPPDYVEMLPDPPRHALAELEAEVARQDRADDFIAYKIRSDSRRAATLEGIARGVRAIQQYDSVSVREE